jgi:formylmethanofuran dehydrogenase subunit E
MSIIGYSFEEYMEIVTKFHGAPAPGVLIGGFMVDLAVRNFPEGVLYDAIAETSTCLPDAVQLLTPCTIGNGWLRVINLGRFAITLYEKERSTEGVRVFLDAEKVKAWPEIHPWFFKLKSKKEQDRDKLFQQIGQAGDAILSLQKVRVRPEFAVKGHKGKIAVCPDCGEAYPVDDGEICLGCRGSAPYVTDKP